VTVESFRGFLSECDDRAPEPEKPAGIGFLGSIWACGCGRRTAQFRHRVGVGPARDRLPRHRGRGSITEGSNPRDLAIIFGVFTGVIGVTGTFLFVQESASRASRASERANAAGVTTGRRTE
jgi:hypothetical protein